MAILETSNKLSKAQQLQINRPMTEMRLFKMLLIPFACVAISFLQSTYAEVGFEGIGSSKLPIAVNREGQKVLELWAPGITESDKGADREISLFPGSQELKDFVSYLKAKFNDQNFRAAMTARINVAEIDRCVRLKWRSCRLTEKPFRGSAFVVDGNLLISVAHNLSYDGDGVSKFINDFEGDLNRSLNDPKSGTASFAERPLENTIFFLTDKSGNLVFDSSLQRFRFLKFKGLGDVRGKVETYFSRIVKKELITLSLEGLANIDSHLTATDIANDYIVVRLGVNLPKIPIARKCSEGEKVYHVGFPIQSSGREVVGGRNSKDRELSAGQGELFDELKTHQRGQIWRGIDPFLADLRKIQSPILFSSSDSAPGLSGGPIMNKRGEVCGIISGHIPAQDSLIERDENNKIYQRFSYGPAIERVLRTGSR